jgi:hypothetical protein
LRSYDIETADPNEIAAIATAAEPMVAAGEEQRQHIKAEFMAASEDELLAGWAE